jgi:signal transduction histidine kinase
MRSTTRTLKTLLFLLAVIPLGGIGMGALIAGWVLVGTVAITPLAVPALVALRAAVGGVARLDATLANRLLGTSVQPAATSPGPKGFWNRGLNVLRDTSFWRQHMYVVLRFSLGFGVAVAEWSLIAASLGLVSLPIWYRWTRYTQVVPDVYVRTLGHALLCVPVGLAGLALAVALTWPIAAGWRFVIRTLLGGMGTMSIRPHALGYGVLNVLLVVVWAATSRGYFWPEWTMLGLGLPLAVHASLVFRRRALTRHALIAASGAVFFTLVWAVTSRGYFWPLWPMLAFALLLAVHAIVEVTRRGERISELEMTRAGAVEQQETDLERIERDLHDGAQARLVALGMSLGMAEQKLASDPAAVQQLLAEARQGTREALAELRNLARGIHPPVLTDRGLEAAISAIADRTPLPVDVAVDVPRRPPRAVETAAYFVVVEALANAGKHAHAKRVTVDVREEEGALVAEVVDDGAGGANAEGSGLRGLARRVEALDGTFEVTSPAGGPTTIRAAIPCVS